MKVFQTNGPLIPRRGFKRLESCRLMMKTAKAVHVEVVVLGGGTRTFWAPRARLEMCHDGSWWAHPQLIKSHGLATA